MPDRQQVVVGLGSVPPGLVEPTLGPDCTFVPDPTDADLSVAVGAIVRADAVVDTSLLDSAPMMKVIARTGVGVDLVDLEEATRRGIPVVITPGSGADAVAEGALGMAMCLAKRFGPLTELVRSGNWDDREMVPVGDLRGSTIGIVGYGRIGRRLGELAAAIGMKVRAYDPFVDLPADTGCATITDLVEISDVISLHLPLVDETRHLVDTDLIGRMRPGALLVNCGRGGLVDLDAVADGLAAGRLGGVALDVYDPEPPMHHRLFDLPNTVLTPHLMGLSSQALAATFRVAAEGVLALLSGGEPAAVANPGWSGAVSTSGPDPGER